MYVVINVFSCVTLIAILPKVIIVTVHLCISVTYSFKSLAKLVSTYDFVHDSICIL